MNVLAHTLHGSPVTTQRLAAGGEGLRLITCGFDYEDPDYVAPRAENKCIGNDHTCNAYKSGGTDFCSGHRKAQAAGVA